MQSQDEAYKEGKSKLQYPSSKHNSKPAMAVDVAICPINFEDTHRIIWFAGYVQAIAQKLYDDGKITHGVRWGGAWRGAGQFNGKGMLDDLMHFELID